MPRGSIAFVAIWSMVLSSAAAAAPVELRRSDKWHLDYGEEVCRLVGTFGEGNQQILIRMARFGPDDRVDLSFYGQPLKTGVPFRKIWIDFGSTNQPAQTTAQTGSAGDLPALFAGVVRLDNAKGAKTTDSAIVPSITPEREAAIRALDLHVVGGPAYRLDLGSMAAPMRLMRDCTDALVKHWGFDPAQVRAWRSGPTPEVSPARWLDTNDYPPGALAAGVMGNVRFRLDVDETGRVTACHIQEETEPARFGEQTCRLLSQRAHFRPALAADGKPTKSFYLNAMHWTLPHN